MAALILPSRRVVQPQQPAQVDWSNPLTRGLLDGLVDFGQGKVSLRGKPVTRENAATIDQITGFRGRRHTSVTDQDSVALEQVARSAATLVIHGTATATAATTWYIAGGVADSAGAPALIYEAGTSFSYFSIWSSAGTRTNVTGGPAATFPVGVKRTLAMAYAGSNLKAYLDGVKVADGAAPASTKAFGSLNSGTVSASAQNYSWYGIAPIILLYDRALSEAEIRALSDNPWQIFKPMSRRIWAPASAPAGQSLTAQAGSYALTGLASTLKAARSLTGSAGSLSLAGSSATLKLGRALSASAGAYSLSGQPATLTRYTPGSGTSYALTAEPGQYRMQGQRAEMAVGMQMVHGWAAPGTAWHALLSPPTRRRLRQIEEEAPEVAQAIEEAAQAAVVQPATSVEPPDFGAIDRRKRETRAAYETFFRNLVDEIRQADEDEQIMRVMAQLL